MKTLHINSSTNQWTNKIATIKIASQPASVVGNWIKSYKVYIDWHNATHNKNLDYPMVEDPNGIPVYHKEDIQGIRQETSQRVFIDNTTENINTQEYFKQYPRNKFYIILSNGKWDPEHYKLPINYVNLTRHMYFYEYCMFVFNIFNVMFFADINYKCDYPKKVEFVSTIGTKRRERDVFLHYLQKHYKSDNMILRYGGKDLGVPASKFDIVDVDPDNFTPSDAISGYKDYYFNTSISIPIDMYNQGYYNLCLEGDIDWPHQFNPTEKIVKCLITGMPFVAFASPLFLQELKKLGFRTYGHLWDESYDLEFDFDKRVEKVVQLCNDLLSFDWQKHKSELEQIKNYNRRCVVELQKLFLIEYEQTVQSLNQVVI